MAARFFKVVLNQNIISSNLMLPTNFVWEHGGELSDTAQLTVSDGRVWNLGLHRRETDQVSLKNSFLEFAKYYSLGHGHWLVFKYKGRSCFRVRIYDKSSTEISYTSHDPNNRLGKNHDDPASDSGKSPRPRNVDCTYTSRCGFPTPRHFKSSRPYFEVKLKEYNFDLNFVYVPANLSKSIRKEQVKNQSIWLEVGNGRRWKVSVLERNAGRLSLGRMREFYLANDLKETDICIFEVEAHSAVITKPDIIDWNFE